ncbi:hypothetical protein DL766_008875 [Monosporascus sp. MC13-8B]|uniref:F-box domain-containing protein n=1 Tax=Monosporascus cannonballus TaxID=155416 RepID=A0ABY0GUV3_9PEZI|nr:hypothetical protein DL762_008905 [Monosporascus cannonballus]RYO92466.1 hypothetical protein DL763_004693 [Monosporascus cannonballus]RYP17600.1 hypothetical protein DL766_008875 [Monosporascus sp. MC13-8B]
MDDITSSSRPPCAGAASQAALAPSSNTGRFTIPNEILLMIARRLPRSDLAALVRTCTVMKDKLNFELYKRDIESENDAIYWSCKNGNTNTLTRALDFGGDVNHHFLTHNPMLPVPDCGMAPLTLAIRYDQLEVAYLLIERKADCNLLTSFAGHEFSPLSVAIRQYVGASPIFTQGLHIIVKALLKEGADPNKATNVLRSPLSLSFHPCVPFDVTKLLLSSKADPMGHDSGSATWRYNWESAHPRVLHSPGDDSVLKFREVLRSSKINDMVTRQGEAILHSVVNSCLTNYSYSGWIRFLEVLLEEKELDINILSPLSGVRILERIARAMKVIANQRLVRVSFDGPSGAQFRCCETVICMLLRAGARPNLTDNETVKARQSALFTLVKCEWHADQAIPALLYYGAHVHVKNRKGETPLHRACMLDSPNAVLIRALLDRGRRPDSKDNNGRTALHVLLRSKGKKTPRLVAAKVLVHHGAHIEALDNAGHTPACYGKANGYVLVINWLRKRNGGRLPLLRELTPGSM